ncbi:hypothetical protein BW730_12585 [Tessaracoccus aquimaris]|uniref:Uncharacterized protein n=1 Tax=Tessaracoccus aquimaris TaxID=1332264 RepID=A0A1Q2CQ87_9ACTN|nr:LacI family DNA-binding transcriptional regulator [Tessaracoccus aquimaris]AQP48215.1 hypothetical protein BW730_12585 [Tessaracoccus aquimaris]
MATLRDIAAHLGLSVSTVSRVLSGKGRVGQDTIDKVLAYAQEIDFHPNQLAQRLKSQSANSIGVVVPDISNEFYAILFKEIDHRLGPAGFTPVLFDIGENPEREREFLGHLRSATVDAMVVATAGSDAYAGLPRDLLSRVVFIDNRPAIPDGFAYVGVDNVRSSFELTQHLINRGHTAIATITGSPGESSAVERTEGFRQAMEANSLELRDEWIAHGRFEYADGYAKAVELLEGPHRPSAIIAQNNVLAYATIRAVRRQSLSVPADVAVACFDHIDTYEFMRPVITTMLQPLDRIAALACDRLEASLAGEPVDNSEPLNSVFRLGETT